MLTQYFGQASRRLTTKSLKLVSTAVLMPSCLVTSRLDVVPAVLLEQTNDINRSTALVGAIALISVPIAAWLMSWWLTKPIARLSAAATAIADGNWDKIAVEREAELGTLADALNRITIHLKASQVALEQQQEKLAQVERVARVGSWEFEQTGVTWSDELFRIYGLEPERSASVLTALRLIHEDDRDRVQQTVRTAFKEGKSFEIEHRIVSNGQVKFVSSRGQARLDSQGKPRSWFGTVADITERKQAHSERDECRQREQEASQSAQAANRIKHEFLAILSHELRTPLNPILGWAQILQRRQFNEETRDYALKTIERNAKLQIQLIEDLLDVSQLSCGQVSLNIGPVNLMAVIANAISQVSIAAEAKSVTIKPMFDPTLETIQGDAKRLQQVVWNLLLNAVKFSSEGGKVEVKLHKVENQAQMLVKDMGKGIAPEFLPYVFDYFAQESSSTDREFGGLGLGLTIVRYLVELHGGKVSASSPGEGLGATFTITLPIVPSSETEENNESRGVHNL